MARVIDIALGAAVIAILVAVAAFALSPLFMAFAVIREAH